MTTKYCLSLFFITLSISANYLKAGFIPDKIDTTCDAIHYVSELANIRTLGAKNEQLTKSFAASSFIKNLILACKSAIDFEILFYWQLTTSKSNNKNEKLLYNIYQSLSAYSCFCNLKFASHDIKRFKDTSLKTENIAPNQKTKQAAWLTINMTLPYILLAIRRLALNKSNIGNIFFYANDFDSNSNIAYDTILLNLSRLIINLSENRRRNILYKQINPGKTDEKNITN